MHQLFYTDRIAKTLRNNHSLRMKSLTTSRCNKLSVLALILVCFLILIGKPTALAQSPLELRVMTFNLRYASTKPPNSWPERRPVMRACITNAAPDIIGTQEGLYHQLKDIALDQPEYEWIGLGRDGGSQGEFMAIFYKKALFEPVEFDHFWLSDTPNVIASAHWGNTNRRMVTWVKFKQRSNGALFTVMNTHLDHAISLAREKGARLIRERATQLASDGLPMILLGDFNSVPGTEKTHEILTQGNFLNDVWEYAKTRQNDGLNTYHDFKGKQLGTARIDWILTRGNWECDQAETVVFSRNGQFPSDHHPVSAILRLKTVNAVKAQ